MSGEREAHNGRNTEGMVGNPFRNLITGLLQIRFLSDDLFIAVRVYRIKSDLFYEPRFELSRRMDL